MTTNNRNGIPIVNVPTSYARGCINPRTGSPKRRYYLQSAAERYIAEVIHPKVRDHYRVYSCGDHFHITSQSRKAKK